MVSLTHSHSLDADDLVLESRTEETSSSTVRNLSEEPEELGIDAIARDFDMIHNLTVHPCAVSNG